MADQDWKTGPLNRGKYVIRKTCKECEGGGGAEYIGSVRGLDDRDQPFFSTCSVCEGIGSVAVDSAAAYFVLRIDGACDPHARKALEAYADSVEPDNPEFAAGIRAWLEETIEQLREVSG